MSSQDSNFTIVKEYFEQLIGLTYNEKSEKLTEIAKQKLLEPNQYALLKSMLQADDATEFATNIHDVSANIIDQASKQTTEILKNKQIGIYKIIKPLGQGGMGSVYLASRNDGTFDQQVALKLPHSSFIPEMLKRFENERQILAQLTHNNIAHLLDGGTTENNQPYLVMEYIEGLAIDHYCIKNLPNLNHRIDLIIQTCNAASFAHQHLVLHRDLKPSNILVTANRHVKLLDFGIAKLLDDGNDNQTATQIMTRNYASPEQIQGKVVGTQSDLFSLAVIAYEIITGYHPFKSDNPHEREQNLVSGTITKITKRVSQKPQFPELATIPASKIKGDLENILLKALANKTEERYQSVKDFAEDLNNFCNNRPVSARKPSFSYSFSKLIQRHKVATFAVALTITTLFGSSYFSYQKAIEAEQQKNNVTEQKELVQKESDKSKEIALFLKNLFIKAKPDSSTKEVSAQDLLKQGLTEINSSKTINPEHKYELLVIIYESFLALGKHKTINDSLEKNYQSCTHNLSQSHTSCQKILISVARMKMNQGNYTSAIQLFSKAENVYLNENKTHGELLAEINTFQFIALLSDKQRKQAILKAENALSFYIQQPEKYTTQILDGLNNLSVANIFAQDQANAKIIIDKMPQYLALLSPLKKPNYNAKYFNLLGFYYDTLNLPKKSAQFRGRAIETIRDNYEISTASFPWYLYKKGKALARSGKIEEAIKLFVESREHYKNHGSGVEINRIKNTIQLALSYNKIGEYPKAKKEIKHINDIGISYMSSYFTDKCDLLIAKAQQALYTSSNQKAEFKIIEYKQACQVYFSETGQDNGEIYQAYLYLLNAELFYMQNNTAKAFEELKKAYPIWDKYPQDYQDLKNLVISIENRIRLKH